MPWREINGYVLTYLSDGMATPAVFFDYMWALHNVGEVLASEECSHQHLTKEQYKSFYTWQ